MRPSAHVNTVILMESNFRNGAIPYYGENDVFV